MDIFRSDDSKKSMVSYGLGLASNTINATDSIDLRKEMYDLLHTKGKGHWILYRRYDRTRYSKYYNEETSEAVGGPKYEFSDEFYKCRREERPNNRSLVEPGQFHIPFGNIYFEYNVNPRQGDEIFEIALDENGEIVYPIQKLRRFTINQVIPWREQNHGRIEYFEVLVRDEVIKW